MADLSPEVLCCAESDPSGRNYSRLVEGVSFSQAALAPVAAFKVLVDVLTASGAVRIEDIRAALDEASKDLARRALPGTAAILDLYGRAIG